MHEGELTGDGNVDPRMELQAGCMILPNPAFRALAGIHVCFSMWRLEREEKREQ
jgi:hypothetical protein